MDKNRRAGKINVIVDGVPYDAIGSFTWNLGKDQREALVGANAHHGYKVMPQVAFIEGEIRDEGSLDWETVVEIKNATVTLELANGKRILLEDAYYAGEGTGNTEEGNLPLRLEGRRATNILA